MFGGFGMSLGLVTLLDALDDRFRSVDEMQSRLGPAAADDDPTARRAGQQAGRQALVTHAVPTSAASESFRTLRTALTLTHPDARQIVVTSAEPGDGKTTTLANLAVCYAQAEKRTLLIDADLRRPGLTGLMDMRGPHGLSEVLRSEVDMSQMAAVHIRPSGIKGLDVLPSGSRPTDPAELLGGPRFSQLLAWAETVYDLVLIDSPPTLATTDTAIIGRLVDGVILVVQPAKNRRRLVMRVCRAARPDEDSRAGPGRQSDRLGTRSTATTAITVTATAMGMAHGYGAAYGHDAAAVSGEAEDDGRLSFADREGPSDDEAQRPLVVPRRVA